MRKGQRHHILFLCASLLCFFVLPIIAHAQVIQLEVGVGAQNQIATPYLTTYLVSVYQFIVGSIGIVAAVMIMFNGMRWVTAAGNSENISTAKGGISSALVGVLIALLSYVLLNALNPALVSFNNLEQSTLTFDEPVTSSVAALDSGNISDDPTLVHYMDKLPPNLLMYLDNHANEPYIKQALYDRLVNALNLLSDSTSPYYGMKLYITAANRSLDKQYKFYSCYQNFPVCDGKKHKSPTCGQTCPAGCQNPGAGGCSLAASPGKSLHGYGAAIDAGWVPLSGTGPFIANTNGISSSFEISCMVNNIASANCTSDMKKSIIGYNTMMQQAGFDRICPEWWHEQIANPGSQAAICSPGVYKD